MKLVKADLLDSAPEAYYTMDLVQLSRDELESMMAQHTSIGGSMSTEALACQWIAENAASLETWTPECLRNPIAFEDLTVDSTVFDPEQLLCGPVKQCPANSILRFINVFICEECGPGDVPDAEQKTCITCDPGFEENINGSVCVACPPGKAKDFGEAACSNCEAGYFTDVMNKSQCDFCTGATFQSEEGQTSCRSCDEQYLGSIALFLGATSLEQCGCPAGTYLPWSGEACAPCPDGFECPVGAKASNFPTSAAADNSGVHPLLEAGYMSLSGAPLVVYRCVDMEYCPGGPPGTCGVLRDSKKVGCGQCVDGAFADGATCTYCEGVDFLPAIVVSMGAFIGGGLVVMFVNQNILMKSSMKLLLACLGGLIMTALQTLT
eukprot:2777573-Amphidinium_carterae.1